MVKIGENNPKKQKKLQQKSLKMTKNASKMKKVAKKRPFVSSIDLIPSYYWYILTFCHKNFWKVAKMAVVSEKKSEKLASKSPKNDKKPLSWKKVVKKRPSVS